MRILLAVDKFKGSLPADEVAQALRAGLLAADPALEITTAPVADGGDGTLAASLRAGFERMDVDAADPIGRPRRATYGRRGDTAVLELAGVCGLALLGEDLDPLGASSLGLGLVLAAALDAGVDRVVLGIGGSASTDGGAGLLIALGARLTDRAGNPIGLGGGSLAALAQIALEGLHPRLADVAIEVACDVDNPLYGPNGAAAIYGPQKGATPAQVELLDANLAHLARVVVGAIGVDRSGAAGAGAAGGVGFGTLLLGGRLRSGIDVMLKLVGFEQAVAGVDLVITGEGSLDEQTLAGKAPVGVALAAQSRDVRVLAVAGRSSLTETQLHAAGIERAYTLADLEPDPARSIANAGPLLWRLGMQIGTELAGRSVEASA